MWLGLDNGITFVHSNSAFTSFFPDGDIEGTCYALATYKGHLYAGTNTGVYQIPWQPYYLPKEQKAFQVVGNSEGQVWSLEQHGDLLLAGHQRGSFIIEQGQAKPVADLIGIWRFLPVQENYLVAGHYGGLALFEHLGNGLKYHGLLEGLAESSRLLAYNNRYVWMAHPYRGIFKNKLSIDKKQVFPTFLNSQNGLPSDFNNYLFQLNNKTVFTGEKGVFKYDETGNQFLPDEGFKRNFWGGQPGKIPAAG